MEETTQLVAELKNKALHARKAVRDELQQDRLDARALQQVGALHDEARRAPEGSEDLRGQSCHGDPP